MIDTALIIDDDPILCGIAESYLKKSGVRAVLVAHDGAEALNFFQVNSNEIDFIILDLAMPHMDGIQLLSKLKDLSYDGSIAIVSGEAPVIKNMATLLAKEYGLKIIDTVTKPLQKAHMDRWFKKQDS